MGLKKMSSKSLFDRGLGKNEFTDTHTQRCLLGLDENLILWNSAPSGITKKRSASHSRLKLD
jgi:hypothetical protein